MKNFTDIFNLEIYLLKEISPGCSLEGLMLKLKLNNILATWCKELTHWEKPWCWERLRAGGEGDDRMRWLDGTTDSMDMSLSDGSWWWTGRPGVLRFMVSQRVGHNWVTELNWTEQKIVVQLAYWVFNNILVCCREILLLIITGRFRSSLEERLKIEMERFLDYQIPKGKLPWLLRW